MVGLSTKMFVDWAAKDKKFIFLKTLILEKFLIDKQNFTPYSKIEFCNYKVRAMLFF